MGTELSFNSAITARLAGITDGQLTHWALTNITVPSISEGRGQGRRKRWAFSDVVGLRVIRELLGVGLSLQMVRRILPALESFTASHTLRALARSRLVVMGNAEVAVVVDGDNMTALFSQHGPRIISSIVINLQPALEDVQHKMQHEGLSHEIAVLRSAGAWRVENRAA